MNEKAKEVHISYYPNNPFSKWLMKRMYEDACKLFNLKFVDQLDVEELRILNYEVI